MIPIPDLTQYELGGITLIVAVFVVLQALKRSHPGLARFMPEIVIVVSAVLVVTTTWAPQVFTAIAGTLLVAALILGSHGVMKNLNKPKDSDK